MDEEKHQRMDRVFDNTKDETPALTKASLLIFYPFRELTQLKKKKLLDTLH